MITRISPLLAKTDFLVIRNHGIRPKLKTNLYTVQTLLYVVLGVIRWHPQWRKYAFFSEPNVVFEGSCMRDIAQFMDEETKAYREIRKKERKAQLPLRSKHDVRESPVFVCE